MKALLDRFNLVGSLLILPILAVIGKDVLAQTQIATSASVSNACFSIGSPVTSIGEWWTSGAFNVVNTCSTSQNASGLQVTITSSGTTLTPALFQFNSVSGLYFPPPVYWAASSGTFAAGNKGAVVLTLNTTGLIQPSGLATVSYGYNPQGVLPGSFSYAFNGGVVAPGSISLSVNSISLKTICIGNNSCKIPLTLTGQNGSYESVVATITNSNAGTLLNAKINGLNPGSYTLGVANSSLPSTVTFSAPTIIVVTGQSVAESALFSITPLTTGSVGYTLLQPGTISLASNQIHLNLLNSSGSSVGSQSAIFGIATSFSNIAAGSYTITSSGLADAVAGIYYAPLKQSVSVLAGGTTNIGNIGFSKVSSGIVPLILNVSGLATGDTATVTITDSNNYTFNTVTVGNGNTTLNLLTGDKVVFNFSVSSKYSAVNPASVTVASGNNIEVPFSVAPAASGQIVGYFETWEATATWESATYSIAAVPAYVNIMPLAFAMPNSTYVAGSYNFAAAGLGISASPKVALGAIKIAQSKGQKVLLSVGGATYQNFANLNVPATIALVNDLGLDGIDIDFEPSSGSCSNLNTTQISCPTDSQLISIIKQFRTALNQLGQTNGKKMYLSAAVWSIGAYGTSSYPTTKYGPVGSNSGIWINPLKQVGTDFDYLFLMSYDAGVYTPTGTTCPSSAAACYDPQAALAAYQSLYSGPVFQGIEVPPEAWGGNVSTPASDLALAAADSKNGGAGIMIWALQVQGNDGAGNVNSNNYLQPICSLFNPGNTSLCNQAIPMN